jgi:hypothetical protein
MHPSTPYSRPELKVYGENITFVFPRTGVKPADRVLGELWKSAARAVGLLVAAIFLFVALPLVQGQLQMFPAAEFLILGMGGFLLLMAILAGVRGIYIYRRRHQQIEAALASTLTEFSVEEGRLVRRYASGHEEIWPRAEIHDVIVEVRFEYVEREDETEINSFAVLCLVLQTGRRVDLWGRAPTASLQEQDLHWMANELRNSLRVPHGPIPPPVENVKLAKTADGITIEVSYREPLVVWRATISGFLAMGISIGGFLYFATGVVFLARWHENGMEGIDWKPIKVVSGVGTSFVALACIGVLVQVIGKKGIVRGITDTTPAWIGVRAGCLFRRYLSGREETWPAEQIAAVSKDHVKDRVQVRLHLKSGAVEHLHGDLHAIAQPREREALAWIADQLTAALCPDPAAPAQTPGATDSIIDLTSPRRDDGQYRPLPKSPADL